ncbi:Putative phospholipase A1 precursor [Moraxella lacunata]|uniref:Phospholipase A1 n=1 Tax=Moraxella lacunata TaxID=477 RepID=A0A378TSB1_MORLA|nr:phospholipase A [Moraxella lacunata]STZ63749.1 Putative phospholipase A1 precursor [Moraxella lacunata]
MKFIPKRLSLAVTLSSLSLGVMSGQAWAEEIALPMPKVSAVQTSEPDIADPVQGERLFFDCASVANDGERLACFDSIALGKVPSVLQDKRPLDLGQTFKRTIKGDPQVVLAETANDLPTADIALTENGADDEINPDISASGFGKVDGSRYTPLSLAYDLDRNSGGLWRARPHNPMYVLPVFVNTKPNRSVSTPTQETWDYTENEMRSTELKFQVSFKSKVVEDLFGTNADMWFGYTQQSHWQVYNEDNSRPFRAHDYQPELFITQPVVADLPFDGKLRMLGAGVVHHSNGEDDPLSRSWNRAYVMAGAEWGNFTVMPRLWARVAKTSDSSRPDDNPDIVDYYGHGDVRFMYQFDKGNNISGTLRYNPKTNKGAVQLDYVRPIGRGVSGYVQLFHGYGQSIIDYNHESTTVGVGVMLNDWMGL